MNEVKNEIKNQFLSSEKASKVLDWEARYSFEEGIKKTYMWYKKYFEVEK
jgi:CDP-glucose 4,6-dehydratase